MAGVAGLAFEMAGEIDDLPCVTFYIGREVVEHFEVIAHERRRRP